MSSLRDRGSATVHATVFIGFLTTVALVAAAAASLFVAQRRAAAAADLAALAGASALQRGASGCGAAGSIAAANHAGLVSCEIAGDVLTVDVSVEAPNLFRATYLVRARARAGPAR